MNERIDSMSHEKILDCYYYPEKHRGALEMILAESYAIKKKCGITDVNAVRGGIRHGGRNRSRGRGTQMRPSMRFSPK
jgi:hypothetical protein